jgi:hypothetical protein
MPKDATPSRAAMTPNAGGPPAASWTQQQQSSIFRIPTPLKRIFDKFPLVQYDENELPLRAPKEKSQHVLHVFTTEKDAKHGRPSFNPGCLKWQVREQWSTQVHSEVTNRLIFQAYLNFSGVEYKLVSSSNHGSPSGVLPFLQPAVTAEDSSNAPDAITSNKLRKWAQTQCSKSVEESDDSRYEAYASLVSNGLRRAWVSLDIEPAY